MTREAINQQNAKLIRIDNHKQTEIHSGDRATCWRLKAAYDRSPRLSQQNHIVISGK